MFKKTYNSVDINHQFDKFEQTFTIHYNKNNPKNGPIVLFIPGCAWLGHTKIIYFLTNVWNSFLPVNLAKKGRTCITLRHRGAFFKNWNILNNFNTIFIIIFFIFFPPFSIFYIIILIILSNLKDNTPCYNDMINDLYKSLKYIDINYDNISNKFNGNRDIILIGYSSGSQMLLELFKRYNINEFKNFNIKDVILLSGVHNINNNILNYDDYKFNLCKKILTGYLSILFDEKLESPIDYVDKISYKKKITIIGCYNEFKKIFFIKDFSKYVFCHKQLNEKLPNSQLFYLNYNHWTILKSKKLLDLILNILDNTS